MSQLILIRQELLFVMESTLKMTWRFDVCCPISDLSEAARGPRTTRCQLPCPQGPSPLLPHGSPLAEHLFPHIQETRLALGIRYWHQMMGHTRPCRGIRARLSHLPREVPSGTHLRLPKEGVPRASLRLGRLQDRTMAKQEEGRLWRRLLFRDLVPLFQSGPGLSHRLPLGRSKTPKQQARRHQLELRLLRYRHRTKHIRSFQVRRWHLCRRASHQHRLSTGRHRPRRRPQGAGPSQMDHGHPDQAFHFKCPKGQGATFA